MLLGGTSHGVGGRSSLTSLVQTVAGSRVWVSSHDRLVCLWELCIFQDF